MLHLRNAEEMLRHIEPLIKEEAKKKVMEIVGPHIEKITTELAFQIAGGLQVALKDMGLHCDVVVKFPEIKK